MRTKRAYCQRLFYTTATFAVLVSPVFAPMLAYAGPENGVVTGGSASIHVSSGTTTIHQSSNRAIIRWDSFDVNAAEHVRFQQPSTGSITVNRITDAKASRIDGRLTANGNVVLINPNGLVFGASSVVDVGGLIATASDIEDDNAFMDGGPVKFTRPGAQDARIVNNGSITVRDAGLAGLVAPHVENNGMIQAKMGRVQLASGDIHTIDFAGDGLIKLEVSDSVTAQSIVNTGTIDAEGGHVLVTAAQARNIADALIVNTGTIKANTASNSKGSITITAHGITARPEATVAPVLEAAANVVINTGTIMAEGDDQNEIGGDILILARNITLGDGSYVSVAADSHGGTIRVGGDYQGEGEMPRSHHTIVMDRSILNASSRRYGRGGRVILWSDDRTEFYGGIESKGGMDGGDGGFVEVSGKNHLIFEGTANLLAPQGKAGVLLLDPTNISISSGGNSNVTGSSPYAPASDDATSVLNVTTLQNALALGNVIVQTRAGGGQSGNITVDSAINWSSGNTLTLDAHANVIVNQAINGGALTMIAGTDVQLLANINGTGTLTMHAAADATTVGLGGGAGVFNVNSADFSYIQNGWFDIVIGRATGTGLITANALTWGSSVTLRSGTGNITLAGIQNTGSRNMTLITNGTVSLNVSNALTGTGTLTLQQATSNSNVGLGGGLGALNLSTTSLGRIADGWSQINIGRADGSGTINMAGSVTWRDNVSIHSGTGTLNVTGAQTFGANNVRIITDGDIALGISNSLYASGGTLGIEQRSANTTIGLGDSQSGIINLSTVEIGRLRDGFTNITIGRADGTGEINIGTTTWVDPLTILSGAGAVNINNTVTTSTNALSITTQNAAVTATGGISQTTGNLSIATNGASIATAAITQTTGSLSFGSGGGGITLSGAMAGTTTGAWSINSGNGVINVNGNVSKTGGSLSFNSGTGQFVANNTLSFGAALGSITAGGNSNIILNNAVSQTTGNLTLTTAGGSILTGVGAIITQSGGGLTMESHGGDITIGAAINATTGAILLNSGNGAISVNGGITKTGGIMSANSGSGQLALGTVAMGAGALTLTTDSDLDLNGNLSGTGALIIAQASAGTSMGIGAGQAGTLLIDAAEFAGIQDGWSSRTIGRMDGAGAVNLADGLNWVDTLVLQSGLGIISLNGSQSFNGNSFTLRTDGNVSIAGNISGTGTFSLVQSSADTSMGIGDGQAGMVSLTTAERNYIVDGWASRIIGRSDGTGALNILGGSWPDAVTLRTGTGQLNINGAMALNGNSLTIVTDSNLYVGGALSSSGNANLSISGVSASTSIGLGTGQAGILHLDDDELARFGTSWRNTYIGSTAMTGDMNIGSRTWDTLILRTGTGVIHINGTMNMAGNALTITTDSDLDIVGGLTGTGTLTIGSTLAATSYGVGDNQGGNIALTNAELGRITNGWGSIVIGSTSGTGSMNIGAYTWNDNITFRTASGAMNINGVQNAQTNNMTFSTNSNIDIGAALTGSGTLTLTTTSASTTVGVGTGQSGVFSLADDELNNITTGWTNVIVGSVSGTGAVNIAGRTWNNSMDFRSGTGALNINGAQNMGANNLSLRSANDLAINYILAGTGTLTIMNSGTTAGYTMAIGDSETGNLRLTDAEIANFAPYGWASLLFGNTSSVAAINVGTQNWDNDITYRNSTGGININGAQSISTGKNMTILSNGDVAINNSINGSGNLIIGQTSATTTMAIGDTQNGAVKLGNAELGRIGTGWNELIFGTTATTTSSYGTLNVGAYTWNNNVTFRTSSMVINVNEAQNAGSHNLKITTNVNPNVAANLAGTGILTINQYAANVSMGVGGTGTVNLTEAEMLRFVNGWDRIVLGRADSTGAMNVVARTWNDDLTLITGSGVLTVSGAAMGTNDLTLITNSNLAVSGNLTGTGVLTIRNASGLTDIAVGDGQTGSVQLSHAEISRFIDGWGLVTIGDAATFGRINIGAQNWVNPMQFVTQGNVVINGAQTTTETSGTTLVYATTGGSFINNVGSNAIDPGIGGRYIVYSVADNNDTINNLVRSTIVTDENYAGYGPDSVVETGNVFIYSGAAAKILYLKIDDADKAYGDLNPSFTYTYVGGLQNDDLLSDVVLGYAISAPGSTVLDDAGTIRAITGNFNAGLGYSVQVINGTLTVVKSVLVVSAESSAREYGEDNPDFTISYSGFKNGDSDADLDVEATASTLAQLTSNVGNYAISVSGGSDDNYEYSYHAGNLSVTKAILDVTSQNSTRIYGDGDPVYDFVYAGFKNGDTKNDIDALATGISIVPTADTGSYIIHGTGALDNNYSFHYVDAGILTVTKAMLTITAQNAMREYGLDNPDFSAIYTGFKNNETQSVINTLASVSANASIGSDVGTYTIMATGAIDNNYDFSYVGGFLSITKAMLTVSADDKSRIYGDGNPSFSITYAGFRNNETESVLNTGVTAGSVADALSGVDVYDITVSGGTDDNYDFNYVGGFLSITKAMLTVSADDKSRIYGDGNPSLTVTYAGFRNNDTKDDINTQAAAATSALSSSNVGLYNISAFGAADNNYDFNYIDGTLEVTKATLIARANDASRSIGSANPGFKVTYSGLRNGETASVIDLRATVSTVADIASPIGTYELTVGGAADNNYDFTYINGLLTVIAKKPVPSPALSPMTGHDIPVTVNASLNNLYKAESSLDTGAMHYWDEESFYQKFHSGKVKSLISENTDYMLSFMPVIADNQAYMGYSGNTDFLIAITEELRDATSGHQVVD